MKSAWWGGDHPVTQPWGCTDLATEPFDARFPGCAHYHQGIDIGWVDAGDQEWIVTAGRPGLKVVTSYIVPSESLLRVTDGVHDYWLFHGSDHSVAVGDQPALGSRLMRVGAIGLAVGPHLHFEVRPAGSPYEPFNSVDPTPLLQEDDMTDPDVFKAIILSAVHGTGQAEKVSQQQVDAWAYEYANHQASADAIIAGIVNTIDAKAYKAAVEALIASGGAVAVDPKAVALEVAPLLKVTT